MYSGGTRLGELRRTAERFEEICREQGAYYGLAFLYDSQYDRMDIADIMKIMEARKLGMKGRN